MITPYKRPPARRAIGVLQSDRLVLCEDGRRRRLDRVDPRVVIYTDGTVAGRLAHRGDGSVIYWNATPIRWVGEREVVILANYPGTEVDVMDGLVAVHDLLSTYNAAGSSLASCSASLLRATIERPLFTYGGPTPPILTEVIGGRQASAQPPGHFGRFHHIDLSAAYARTLGEMPYGGYWVGVKTDRLPTDTGDRAVMVRARVWVPDMTFGPLPRRFRVPPKAGSWERALVERDYPRGGSRLSSTWTLEEVRVAERVGCGVEVRAVHVEIGHDDRTPFAEWWDAIQRFRALDGWGSVFGKMMGNALWGRFALDDHGERRQVAWNADNVIVRNRRLPKLGQHLAAWDIAEMVAGRVRARLYDDVMIPYADRLISVHTDGALLYPGDLFELPSDWRLKIDGDGLIYLGPQSWAYTNADGETVYKVSGIAPRHVRRAFAEMTKATLRGGRDRPRYQPREDPWEQTMLEIPA